MLSPRTRKKEQKLDSYDRGKVLEGNVGSRMTNIRREGNVEAFVGGRSLNNIIIYPLY
jgi:hypothetical protein